MKEKIQKLYNLLLISRQKLTTKDLCSALEVSPRTLIKYVNIARTKHHLPISSDRTKSGGYWVDLNYYESPIKKNAVSSIKAIKSLEGSNGIQDVFRKANQVSNANQLSMDI